MKTEKIKHGHDLADEFEWKAKCSRAYEEDCKSVLWCGSVATGSFSRLARDYEIICKPKYIPYSEDTFDELEEKAMRMTVIHRATKNRYIITSMLCNSFRIHDTSYTYNESIDSFKWSDGSIFGTEDK